jgi:hypothetical protein
MQLPKWKQSLLLIGIVALSFLPAFAEAKERVKNKIVITEQPTTLLLGASDKGFRFDGEKNHCLHKNEMGFNPGHIGECGHLSVIPEERIKNIKFSGLNLKGAKFDRLNLTKIEFKGSQLQGASFVGANMNDANMSEAVLTNALYDETTKLPFSEKEAKKRGMIKWQEVARIDDLKMYEEIKNGGTPENEDARGPQIGIGHEFDELVSTQDIETVKADIEGISTATDGYHNKLLSLVKKVKKIDAIHLGLILDVCYFKPHQVKTYLEEFKKGQKENWNEIQKYGNFNNAIFLEGVQKLTDPTWKNIVMLGSKTIPTVESYQVQQKFLSWVETNQKPNNEKEWNALLETISPMGKNEIVTSINLMLFNEYGAKSKDRLIKMAKNINEADKTWFYLKALPSVAQFKVSELNDLVKNVPEVSSYILRNHLLRARDLTADKLAKVAEQVNEKDRDDLIEDYLKNVDIKNLDTKNFITLLKPSFNKIKLASLYMKRVRNLSPQTVVEASSLLQDNEKNQIIDHFLEIYPEALTAQDVIKISRSSYQEENSFKKELLPRLSETKWVNVEPLIKDSEGTAKDLLIENWMKKPDIKISSDDYLKIMNAAYNKKEEFRLSYLKKVSPINNTIFISLLKEAQFQKTKELLVQEYLKSKPSFKGFELIEMITLNKEQGEKILKEQIKQVSDWSVATVDQMCLKANQKQKEIILSEFLNNQMKEIKTKELIMLSNHSPSLKKSILMNYLSKIEDLTLESSFELIKPLENKEKDLVLNFYMSQSGLLPVDKMILVIQQSHDKESILKKYLEDIQQLTSQDLLQLSQFSKMYKEDHIVSHLNKLTDLDISKTQALMKEVKGNLKDQIVQYFMEHGPKEFTGFEIQSLSSQSHQLKKPLLTKYLDRISDLNIKGCDAYISKIDRQDRLTVVQYCIQKNKPLKTVDLLSFTYHLNATEEANVITNEYGELKSLSFQDTLNLTQKVQGANKDEIIMHFLSKSPKIKTTELMTLREIATLKKDEIISNNLHLLEDFSTSKAVEMADFFQTSDRDEFIFKAMDEVKDLNKENLEKLARKSYARKNVILQRKVSGHK